ncbi:hypothetical protein B0T26DRAFT_757852 [Lasiosphaeria miniovina]|uniref:gamma-glutamylcyclotransferase n=1 Tax=Lasiosphaeria miniovina TaxID=1954250 RepID=A0AA39ZQU0_9PEZI|nr:uncharacterized protein B0T26DRAFT_757852 [Lasiosphaeria miniovina]KAK0701878.1 hypothetical protein B0T26DRAFT_757852 [Lasiosphaeria miniovina]
MGTRLYFAYGSNLSLDQMAARCPQSTFRGRAVLPDFQWQINQRGVANIVPRAGSSVHGLVYELGAGDEKRLDRNEGVRAGFYSKALLPVVLHPATDALQMRTARIVTMGGAAGVVHDFDKLVGLGSRPRARLEPEVLVYVSETYVQTGEPRDEYVDRMNRAMEDGVAMGIPTAFFLNTVREHIPSRPAPAPAPSPRPAYRPQPRERSWPPMAAAPRAPDGYTYRRPTTLGRRTGGDDAYEYEYEHPRRPLSRAARDYVYTSYYAGTPVIRTVSPDASQYPARGRWSSAL